MGRKGKDERKKTKVICWNCGHAWKTSRCYEAYCRECRVLNNVQDSREGGGRAGWAVGKATLPREDLVRVFLELWYGLDEVITCEACRGSGVVYVSTGTGLGEADPEPCECRARAEWVMHDVIGARLVTVQREFLRSHGHDPDEEGTEAADDPAEMVARLLAEYGGDGEIVTGGD